MKTLTMFAAAATLIAGVGLASAQNSQGPAAAKPQAAGTGKFCMTTKDGPKNCSFMTMAACQTAAKGKKGTCAANPQNATTGSK